MEPPASSTACAAARGDSSVTAALYDEAVRACHHRMRVALLCIVSARCHCADHTFSAAHLQTVRRRLVASRTLLWLYRLAAAG